MRNILVNMFQLQVSPSLFLCKDDENVYLAFLTIWLHVASYVNIFPGVSVCARLFLSDRYTVWM